MEKLFFLIWCSSFLILLAACFETILNAPKAENSAVDLNSKSFTNSSKKPNNCCIITKFTNSSIENLLILGYSLKYLGEKPPKIFAITNETIPHFFVKIIRKYFIYINHNDENTIEKEENINIFEECDPYVIVSNKGIFLRSPWDLCYEKPNSGYFQSENLFAINPHLLLTDKAFATKYLNGENIFNISRSWNILPPYYIVEDVPQWNINYLLAYTRPYYLKYSNYSYSSVLRGSKINQHMSVGIYRIIFNTIQQAFKELFNISNPKYYKRTMFLT